MSRFYALGENVKFLCHKYDQANTWWSRPQVRQAHESFYSEVITLVIGGKEVAVKVQAMQRHPFKPKLVHIDFKRA